MSNRAFTVVAAVLLAASCGGGEKPSATIGTTPGSSAPAPNPSPSSARAAAPSPAANPKDPHEAHDHGKVDDGNLEKQHFLETQGLYGAATPVSLAAGRAAPRLLFGGLSKDFGKVLDGTTLEHEFAFENAGDAALVVQRVQPSCGCTVPAVFVGEGGERYEFGRAIPPGVAGRMQVTFATKGFNGPKTSSILVYSNDPAGVSTLSVTAEVQRFFAVEPITLTLGEVGMKEEKTGTVTVSSAQVESFEIQSHNPVPPGLKVSWERATPDSRNAYAVNVTIGPGMNEGMFSQPIVLQTDQGRTIEFYMSATVVGPVQVLPAGYLPFGLVQRGTKVSKTLEVKGRDPDRLIHVTEVEVIAPDPATPWAPQGQGGAAPSGAPPVQEFLAASVRTVEPGKHYVIEVTAAETMPACTFRGTLRIKTDHPEVPAKDVMLSGVVR